MRDMQRDRYTRLFSQSWLLVKIIGSFFAVFVYMLLIAPYLWAPLHLEWSLIVLLFWHYTGRNRVGILSAWIVGLFADVLFGTTLGVHAFLYGVNLYVVQLFYAQFHHNTVLMQYVFVAVLLLLTTLVRLLFLDAATLFLTSEAFVLIAQVAIGALMWVILTSLVRTR